MNKFLKVMFIVLITAMTGAMIFQIFFPEVMGAHSGYGCSWLATRNWILEFGGFDYFSGR